MDQIDRLENETNRARYGVRVLEERWEEVEEGAEAVEGRLRNVEERVVKWFGVGWDKDGMEGKKGKEEGGSDEVNSESAESGKGAG